MDVIAYFRVQSEAQRKKMKGKCTALELLPALTRRGSSFLDRFWQLLAYPTFRGAAACSDEGIVQER